MNNIIECTDLSKVFGNGRGLHELNLDVPRGKIIGLLGSNGSGKSTFLKLINGLLVPSKGKILIDGKIPGKETKRIVSYLPERSGLYTWMKVKELIQFYTDFYEEFDKEKAVDLIELLHIDLEARMKTLSKGNREKIALVLAMCRQAQLYCLDEPIGGVDPAAREYIIKTILNNYNRNATLLISTHMILDIESILDYCIFIKDGMILKSGAVEKLRQGDDNTIDDLFRRMYRC